MKPACDLIPQAESDLDRYRRVCTSLRSGETAQWCARYGLPTSGEDHQAVERARNATAQPQQSALKDDQPSEITLTDEDFRRICANLKPCETAPWCKQYGFDGGSECVASGSSASNSRPATITGVGDSFWQKTGRGLLTAGKVAVAVPVVAVLAALWVLSKFGEGMAQNPTATALLLQQLQVNQSAQRRTS
jgi:hypothetical protein